MSVNAHSVKILVVDDDQAQRSLLSTFLTRHHFNVTSADCGEKALQLLRNRKFDMMISDVRMPGISGIETMTEALKINESMPILMVTAFPDIKDAVNAVKHGAVNYLEKPIDLDELYAVVSRATGVIVDTEECSSYDHPEGVVARSSLMKQALKEASFVAPTESRVLITGESGTGKEVISQLIHKWSGKSDQPFVKVNCAAIPENLLESELFGHEKGAFTGAVAQRIGRFEEASQGTIFLDEIGEVPMPLQAKLLRVLQDGTFQRVGSNKEFKTTARIIAATNRNLEDEIEKGNFREDLFYRLNIFELFLAPLRERKDDILPLATQFAQQFSGGNARFSASVSTILSIYEWPGNVRELQNAMERATLMARGSMIMPEHLPQRVTKENPNAVAQSSSSTKIEDMERILILQALRDNNDNRTEAAKALGIGRRTLQYKLKKIEDDN